MALLPAPVDVAPTDLADRFLAICEQVPAAVAGEVLALVQAAERAARDEQRAGLAAAVLDALTLQARALAVASEVRLAAARGLVERAEAAELLARFGADVEAARRALTFDSIENGDVT